MLIEVGHVEAIFRYPVKSMAGERLEHANLGWYGLDGDRRFAFRRVDDRSGIEKRRPMPIAIPARDTAVTIITFLPGPR